MPKDLLLRHRLTVERAARDLESRARMLIRLSAVTIAKRPRVSAIVAALAVVAISLSAVFLVRLQGGQQRMRAVSVAPVVRNTVAQKVHIAAQPRYHGADHLITSSSGAARLTSASFTIPTGASWRIDTSVNPPGRAYVNVLVIPDGSSQPIEVYTAHGFGSTSHRMVAPPGRYHIQAFGGGQITFRVVSD
jgi:hypothetical protein